MKHGSKESRPLYPIPFALNVLGRGLVVLAAVPDPMRIDVQAGDPIELVRPDGSTFRTVVKAIDLKKGCNPGLLGLVMPEWVVKDQIPFGTMLRFLKTM